MSKKYFQVAIPAINGIISIKNFNEQQITKFTKELRTIIEKSNGPSLDLGEYKLKVITKLVVNSVSLLKEIEEELIESSVDDIIELAEVKDEVLSSIYIAVISAYPSFSFEFICWNNNSSLFQESGMLEYLEKLYGSRDTKNTPKEAVEPKTDKKTKKISLSGVYDLPSLVKAEDYFRKNLVGQDEAIDKVLNAIKLIISGLANSSSLFFIGPTGVGKTKLARLVGEKYSGNFFKINCAEYANSHEYAKLVGSPPGYIGHNENSILSQKAEISNKWTFLFDEIEKAHEQFYEFLLALLDDGRITDNMGKDLDFSKSLFLFSSNKGLHELKIGRKRVGFSKELIQYETSKDELLEQVKDSFSPEFLGRLDHFVFFNKLNEEQLRQVVKIELESFPIKRTKELVTWILDNSNHEEYGARNINKFIKNNVAIQIADALLNKIVPISGKLYSSRINNLKLEITSTKKYKNEHHKKEMAGMGSSKSES